MIHKIDFGSGVFYTGDRGWEMFKSILRHHLQNDIQGTEKKSIVKTHFGEFTITTPDLYADDGNKD